MQRITVLCVGKLKEKFYADAAAEYIKRLSRYCKIEVTELPETRLPEDPSPAEIKKALAAEANAIRQKLEGGAVVVLDAALILFSFYFALLLRADGAVEAAWWPHNRALLYDNLPWIVALYLISFLVGGLYSTLWKYAGERDLIRLGGMIAVPTGVVYFVNHFCVHGVLFDSANAMAAVLIFLLVGGSRLAWRLFLNHPLGERLRGVASRDPNRPVMIVGAGAFFYYAFGASRLLNMRLALKLRDPVYIAVGIVGLLVLAELCRRSVGVPILCVAGFFLAYTVFNFIRGGRLLAQIPHELFYGENGVLTIVLPKTEEEISQTSHIQID